MHRTSLRDILAAASWRAVALSAVCLAGAVFAHPQPVKAVAPASCPPGRQVTTLHLSDFEEPPATHSVWRARPLTGSAEGPAEEGRLAGSHWHYPPPARGTIPWSGSFNIWADIAGAVPTTGRSSSAIEMRSQVVVPGAARLSFVHRFDLTAAPGSWAAVESSLDGGRTWQELGGFTGESGGLRSSHFDLAAPAGGGLQLRFRLFESAPAGHPAAGFRGWAIDDVHIYSCESAAPVSRGPLGADPQKQRPGSPEFAMWTLRQPRVLRGRSTLRVRLANASRAPMRRLRVCFRAPRRIVAGSRCASLKLLPAGSSAEVAFPIRLLPAAAALRRPRISIGFVARRKGIVVATTKRTYRLAAGRDLQRRSGARSNRPR